MKYVYRFEEMCGAVYCGARLVAMFTKWSDAYRFCKSMNGEVIQ